MSKKRLVLGAIAAAVVALYFSGALEHARPAAMQRLLLDLGMWGPVLFVACFTVVQLLQGPSLPFLIAAPLTWSAAVALPTLWICAILGGLPGFVIARYIAHDWVQARLPARLHRYDHYITTRGLRAIIVLRLFFFTAPYVPPMIALTRTRFRDYLVGTAIGVLPGVLLWSVYGAAIFAWARRQPASTWIVVAGTVCAIVVAVQLYRRRMVPQAGEA